MQASVQPQVFLDLRYESPSQVLAASVHRQLAGAVSQPHGKMSATALMSMVVWPKSYARLRNELKAPFRVVTGVMSRREGAYNLVVERPSPCRSSPTRPSRGIFMRG